MNIKQFKKKLIYGLIEPELFKMPVGKKKGTQIQNLHIDLWFTYSHAGAYEELYHGWMKEQFARIDGARMESAGYDEDRNAVFNFYLNYKKIGEYHRGGEQNLLTHSFIDVEIQKKDITVYGINIDLSEIGFTGGNRQCHPNSLWGHLVSANPYVQFNIKSNTVSRTIKFYLLDTHRDVLNSENNNLISFYVRASADWFVFFDYAENCIKSQLRITSSTTGITDVFETVVYENFL